MIRYAILCILSLVCLTITAQELGKSEKAEQFLVEMVDDGKVVGVAAGIITKDSIVWLREKGLSDLKTESEFTVNSITRIASITKPMTAIAIMQLMENNQLKIDETVSKYLPQFASDELDNITIRHLLQHSSGIGEYKNKKEANNKIEYENLEEALKLFVNRKLLFNPGSNFSYTSYGYVVLGRIIEVVSGMDYGSFMKENIFDPAGMTQTSIEEFELTYKNKASSYHQNKPGKFELITEHNLSNRVPGGGIQSTVNDLLKFAKAILNNTLISKESLAMTIVDSGLKKEGNGYGMGWYLYGINEPNGNVFGHNGGQLGCSSFLFILPEQDTAVVVLSNTSGALQDVGRAAVALFQVANELDRDP